MGSSFSIPFMLAACTSASPSPRFPRRQTIGPTVLINNLSEEILLTLFTYSDLATNVACSLVNREWRDLNNDPQIVMDIIYENGIGCKKWNLLINGKLSQSSVEAELKESSTKGKLKENFTESELKEERSLRRPDIKKILRKHLTQFSPKSLKRDYGLIYIPKTINGQHLTLDLLNKYMLQYYPNRSVGTGMRYISIAPIEKSSWLLVTEIIPATINQPPAKQRKMIENLASASEVSYTLPNVLVLAAYQSMCVAKIIFVSTPPSSIFNKIAAVLMAKGALYSCCLEPSQGVKKASVDSLDIITLGFEEEKSYYCLGAAAQLLLPPIPSTAPTGLESKSSKAKSA